MKKKIRKLGKAIYNEYVEFCKWLPVMIIMSLIFGYIMTM